MKPEGGSGGASVGFAGEAAYGAVFHGVLVARGIGVRELVIPGAIGGGDPLFAPAALPNNSGNSVPPPGPFRVTVGESTT